MTTPRDLHRLNAAKYLGIPYDEVTPEQRRQAKAVSFYDLYGGTGPIRFELDLSGTNERKIRRLKRYVRKHPESLVAFDHLLRFEHNYPMAFQRVFNNSTARMWLCRCALRKGVHLSHRRAVRFSSRVHQWDFDRVNEAIRSIAISFQEAGKVLTEANRILKGEGMGGE